jgi:hypothetical protein
MIRYRKYFISPGKQMKVHKHFVILLAIALASCSAPADSTSPTPSPAITPPASATPDPCTPDALPGEVNKVNKIMREFDDYTALASSTPVDQLLTIMPEIQRVRRDAEDLNVPPCLLTLKKLQLAHMNIVIQTLLAFMGKANAETINAGIAQSREWRTQYDVEIARLLGVTVVSSPTQTTIPPTP